jgi:[phosphatase 2A protein]-leucine-carboxy methyltransferase
MTGRDELPPRLPSLAKGREGGLSLGAPRRAGPLRDATLGNGSTQSTSGPSSLSSQKADAAVRMTDNDAAGSRLAAINSKYLASDPYSHLLGPVDSPIPRPPIINIGTYLRCTAIDTLVANFLNQGTGKKQIISLGAGSDARYWKLCSSKDTREKLHHYVELDFVELTTSKLEKILRNKTLLDLVTTNEESVHICECKTVDKVNNIPSILANICSLLSL